MVVADEADVVIDWKAVQVDEDESITDMSMDARVKRACPRTILSHLPKPPYLCLLLLSRALDASGAPRETTQFPNGCVIFRCCLKQLGCSVGPQMEAPASQKPLSLPAPLIQLAPKWTQS